MHTTKCMQQQQAVPRGTPQLPPQTPCTHLLPLPPPALPSLGLDKAPSRAGGDKDAQAAAMSADAGSGNKGEITSDSVAERVAQEFGVWPEASPGAAEAESYRAEAGQEGGEDKGQSA
jgi:hypothetical protein